MCYKSVLFVCVCVFRVFEEEKNTYTFIYVVLSRKIRLCYDMTMNAFLDYPSGDHTTKRRSVSPCKDKMPGLISCTYSNSLILLSHNVGLKHSEERCIVSVFSHQLSLPLLCCRRLNSTQGEIRVGPSHQVRHVDWSSRPHSMHAKHVTRNRPTILHSLLSALLRSQSALGPQHTQQLTTSTHWTGQ